jgi:hypothetical protein
MLAHNDRERPFFVSKHILDTVNSLSWFIMDASWMFELSTIYMIMLFPTLLTGLFLCYIERDNSLTMINIAIFNWICMNVSWMFSETYHDLFYLSLAKIFFGMGVLFMMLAVVTSKNLADTFSHFKRFRMKTPKE